jgi:hypothetical protein
MRERRVDRTSHIMEDDVAQHVRLRHPATGPRRWTCCSETRAHVLHRGAVIIGAKGGLLRQITVGDVMELLDAETRAHARPMAHGSGFYRMRHRMGIFEAAAPQMLRELTASRQRTPAALTDRYDLACRPVRDLLVDYLKERQPALDEIFTIAGQTLTRSVTTYSTSRKDLGGRSGHREATPLVRAYDRRECLWIGPAPLLFQRRFGADNRRICDTQSTTCSTPPWPAPA